MKCTEAWNISIKYERATANTWATAKYISEHDRRLRTLKWVNFTSELRRTWWLMMLLWWEKLCLLTISQSASNWGNLKRAETLYITHFIIYYGWKKIQRKTINTPRTKVHGFGYFELCLYCIPLAGLVSRAVGWSTTPTLSGRTGRMWRTGSAATSPSPQSSYTTAYQRYPIFRLVT